MDPSAWRDMVNRSRELEAALGTGLKRVEDNEKETVVLQRRSIRLRADCTAGQRITADDVEMLRPCPIDALAPYATKKILGKKLRHDMSRGAYLRLNDFE